MLPLIIGFGEALIDILPSGEVIGGAPLNFSLRVAELGQWLDCRSALITRVGKDERGARIVQLIEQSSLDVSGVQVDSQLPTGYVNVTLNDGQPDYTIAEQVAWEAIASNDDVRALASRATAICFGTLSQRGPVTAQTLTELLQQSARAVKILDLNLRKPNPSLEIIRWSLQQADVLKCNTEEICQLASWLRLADASDLMSVAGQLQEQFQLRSIFLTQGAEGCCWLAEGRMTSDTVPRLPQHSEADSVGAGDAASAALAVGLVHGWEVARIVRVANWCGAYAASTRGATTPIDDKSMREILA